MPKFIDHHATMPQLSPEMAKQMAGAIKAGKADQHGVTGINVFVGNGQGWCLSEAPSADAVLKSHQAVGVPLERHAITEVKALV